MGPLHDVDEHWVRLTPPEALTNLRTVLELCAAGDLKCSEKTGRPSAATIRTIGAQLADGDFYAGAPIASFAWPLLIQAGGLARLDGTRLQPTPKGRAALGKPPAEVIRHLWQRWLTHAVIDEVQPDRKHQGSALPQRADRGEDPPPDGRRGADRMPRWASGSAWTICSAPCATAR